MKRADAALWIAAIGSAVFLGWYVRQTTVDDCAARVHRERPLCHTLGGLMDIDENGRTFCYWVSEDAMVEGGDRHNLDWTEAMP